MGESGSGKSVSAMTLMGLTRSPNANIEGQATLADGTELLSADDDLMQDDARRAHRDDLPGPDERADGRVPGR